MPVFIANRQWVAVLLAVFMAVALSACGGGGSTSAPQMPDPGPMPDPQMACEDAGGRYNADGTCTSAEDLAAEQLAMERGNISTAITAASTAVNAVNNDSTDAQVTAADTAIMNARDAIATAANVPADEKAANTGTVDALATQLSGAKMARQTAMDTADEAMQKAMAAAGKALKKALGDTPLTNLLSDSDTPLASISGGSLTLGVPDPADTNTPPTTAISGQAMKAGDSAGALGSWAGTHYAHTNPGTKVSNSAIVYTNRAAPKVKPFATGARFGGNALTVEAAATGLDTAGDYHVASRTMYIGATLTSTKDVAGDMFPTAGVTTYTADPTTNAVVLRGTYQGAAGSYRCTGTTCTAAAGSSGAIELGGTAAVWAFVHDSGAMTSTPDANYLFFGWWLTKDKDGDPTSASAFTGVVGSIQGDGTTALATDPAAATQQGSATYAGHAAGKFAINNPLGGSDAGHFTADATLTAKFGNSATAGVSGTLENFMANEKAVPWSVSLNRAAWGTSPVGSFASTAAVANVADRTTWSIDGKSGGESGSWSGQAYDEKPGNAPTGDGSNVPTSLTGRFHSEFGSTHTMVGAFGATKE